MQGQGEEGIAQIRQGLDAIRATGAEHLQPWYRAVLVAAYRHVGQVETGLALLTDTLGRVHTTGERAREAELYRLRGELLLQQGVPDATQAEAYFHHALALARHQHAKSWELQAAISMSRLWQQQGKSAAARQLLAEVYDWFTEGFDTADLREARALLADLARGATAALS
jgi:predicted ATPase